MIRNCALAIILVLLVFPASAIEPDQRQVIVTHNRVWDGFAYKENFVPSDTAQMLLLAEADNAVAFVETLEYYWPLSRQKYVAFEKQRNEVDGTLEVRRDGKLVKAIEAQKYAIIYPQGALKGNARFAWGEEADATYAEYVQEQKDFVREMAAARRAHVAYEKVLREAAITRLKGGGVQAVEPPDPLPGPLMKLVTEPDVAYRINLPAGDYDMELVRDGMAVAGTNKKLRIIEAIASDVLTADIVPEERWTRPLQANIETDRIYVRPGSEFYVTLSHASRFSESDYHCLIRPQSCMPSEGDIWIRRDPAPEFDELEIAWMQKGGPNTLGLTDLKVEQTQGASFGYVVRPARPEEKSDLTAFVVKAPTDPAHHTAVLSRPGDAADSFSRQIILVQPRSEVLAWSLAFLPAVFGAFVSWRRWRHAD